MLTEARIRAAKPRATPYKLADGRGLYLLVSPSGGRLWRVRYRYAGRENKAIALEWLGRQRVAPATLEKTGWTFNDPVLLTR